MENSHARNEVLTIHLLVRQCTCTIWFHLP
uniref:Uncharacterized protein n=1 Tax=Rhizophora mucronata TaxID=61149 RepID=A0A2P2J2Q4_RHIMU